MNDRPNILVAVDLSLCIDALDPLRKVGNVRAAHAAIAKYPPPESFVGVKVALAEPPLPIAPESDDVENTAADPDCAAPSGCKSASCHAGARKCVKMLYT